MRFVIKKRFAVCFIMFDGCLISDGGYCENNDPDERF